MNESTISIRFAVEMGLGKGDSVDLSQIREFPYLPRIGDMIVVHAGDDFREVEQVYYSETDGFEVFLKFDQATAKGLKSLKKIGWSDQDA